MKTEEIIAISLNSGFCSEILCHFASGFKGESVRNELMYLVLPLVLNKESREKLARANTSSSIYSVLLNEKDGILVGGIERRIELMKKRTSTALILAHNQGLIDFGVEIRLKKVFSWKPEKHRRLKEIYKSAHYLGLIFSKVDTIEIILALGIRRIFK